MSGPEDQSFERHLALRQFLLEYVRYGFQFELIFAGQHDLMVLLNELDVGLGVLQIVALQNLFHGLLDGVVHFRQIDF